jgi:aspartyl protease family protein
MNRRLLGVVALLAGVGAAAFLFRDQIAGLTAGETTRFVYLLLLLALVGGGVFAARRGGIARWLRDAALWVLIFIGIAGAYAFRDQVSAVFNPSAPRMVGDVVEVRRADDGHFWADVEINDTRLRMLIDTGASDIALSPRDARRIGVDPSKLRYSVPIRTAQGATSAAPVMLDKLRLGGIELKRVEALVMADDIDVSLIGMSFLDRLDGYEVRSNAMLLRAPPKQE